jgi:molybdopterin/thiamine biosynthesis adenylyltransferase
MTPLLPHEIERYARHIVLVDIGGPGQQTLKASRVLIVKFDEDGAIAGQQPLIFLLAD